jgi:hypothetical protein
MKIRNPSVALGPRVYVDRRRCGLPWRRGLSSRVAARRPRAATGLALERPWARKPQPRHEFAPIMSPKNGAHLYRRRQWSNRFERRIRRVGRRPTPRMCVAAAARPNSPDPNGRRRDLPRPDMGHHCARSAALQHCGLRQLAWPCRRCTSLCLIMHHLHDVGWALRASNPSSCWDRLVRDAAGR